MKQPFGSEGRRVLHEIGEQRSRQDRTCDGGDEHRRLARSNDGQVQYRAQGVGAGKHEGDIADFRIAEIAEPHNEHGHIDDGRDEGRQGHGLWGGGRGKGEGGDGAADKAADGVDPASSAGGE